MLSANPGRTVREFEQEFTQDRLKSVHVGQIIPPASIFIFGRYLSVFVEFQVGGIILGGKPLKPVDKLSVCGDLFGGEWFRR